MFTVPWNLITFSSLVAQQWIELPSGYLILWKWEVCVGCRCTCASHSPLPTVIHIFDTCRDVGIVSAAALWMHTSSELIFSPKSLRKKKKKKFDFRFLLQT